MQLANTSCSGAPPVTFLDYSQAARIANDSTGPYAGYATILQGQDTPTPAEGLDQVAKAVLAYQDGYESVYGACFQYVAVSINNSTPCPEPGYCFIQDFGTNFGAMMSSLISFSDSQNLQSLVYLAVGGDFEAGFSPFQPVSDFLNAYAATDNTNTVFFNFGDDTGEMGWTQDDTASISGGATFSGGSSNIMDTGVFPEIYTYGQLTDWVNTTNQASSYDKPAYYGVTTERPAGDLDTPTAYNTFQGDIQRTSDPYSLVNYHDATNI